MAVSSFNIGEVEGSIKTLYDQVRNEVTDLNTPLTTGTSVPVLNYYQSTASNKPTGNSGIVFTMFDGSYRMQTVFELAGRIYTRYYASGTITDWASLSDQTIKVKRKTGQTTVSANSYTELKLSDLGFTTPTGYSIADVLPSFSGSGTSSVIVADVSDVSLGYVCFKNLSGTSKAINYAINVIYTPTGNIESVT